MEMGEFCTDISPKDYGEELALCRRFFYRMKSKGGEAISSVSKFCVAFSNQTDNINTFVYSIAIPDMRIIPTVSFKGKIGLACNDISYWINEENTQISACFPTEIVFQTTIEQSASSNIGFVRSEFDNNSSFDFDAEIY
jgi:hypothetical protein